MDSSDAPRRRIDPASDVIVWSRIPWGMVSPMRFAEPPPPRLRSAFAAHDG